MKQEEIDALLENGITFKIEDGNVVLSNGIVLKKIIFCDECLRENRLKMYFCDKHNFSYLKWYVGMVKALSE